MTLKMIQNGQIAAYVTLLQGVTLGKDKMIPPRPILHHLLPEPSSSLVLGCYRSEKNSNRSRIERLRKDFASHLENLTGIAHQTGTSQLPMSKRPKKATQD